MKNNIFLINSPNFNKNIRKRKQINFLIYHYTGMQSVVETINRLCDIKSKVSCHYLIDENGKIIQLVQDNYIAWHAGKSGWKKFKSINKFSIGIELVNPGHKFGYKNFTNKQITALTILSKKLIKKYKIKKQNILGHSDIAPLRKKDPGEKFPWKFLTKKKIGIWHTLNNRILTSNRKKNTSIKEKFFF